MMKSTLRIFIVLLLMVGICFGGLSCGSSKSKSKKRDTTSQSEQDKAERIKKEKEKKEKERKKREAAKKAEEPVVPAKPPLPQDLSQWGSKDFIRAREEGHPRLVEACVLLGEPFEGEPSAASAVEIIRQILLPLPIPEMKQIPKPVITEDTTQREKQQLEREYAKKVKAEEERVKNVPKLDSRSISALAEILGQNGDDAAWKLLLEMLQRKIIVDDDTEMDKYVVQTILAHPRSNNVDIVFTMLTDPASLLRPELSQTQKDKKDGTGPEWIRKQASDWVKKYADPAFRERLTQYLVEHPKDKALKELVLPILLDDKAGNIQVKAMLYNAASVLTDVEKQKIERYFLDCSASAFAALTYQSINSGKTSANDLTALIQENKNQKQEDTPEESKSEEAKPEEVKSNEVKTEDAKSDETKSEETKPEEAKDSNTDTKVAKEDSADNTQDSKPTQKVGKNGTYRLEPYEDIPMDGADALKVMILNPEIAQKVLQIVWKGDFISKQVEVWEKTKSFKSKEIDPTTRFLLALPIENYRQYWSEYFNNIYQDGPAETGLDKCPLMGVLPIDPGVLMELKKMKRNIQPLTTQKKGAKVPGVSKAKEHNIALQAAWMNAVRFAVRAQMDRCNASCPIQPALGINTNKLKARIPFNIPEGAKVLAEYHLVFPTGDVRKLTGINFDPYEIHFVSISWNGPASTLLTKIKYKDSGVPKLRYSSGQSSDKMIWLEYNNEDFSESMDIRFPGKGTSKDALKAPISGPIQIMSIRVKPTGE